jgi:hypothetical protein
MARVFISSLFSNICIAIVFRAENLIELTIKVDNGILLVKFN